MAGKRKKILNFCVIVFIVILVPSISPVSFSGPAEAYITKGRTFQAKGDYVMAINEFYKAIIKEPSYPHTYNHLAVISEIVLKDYDSASIFYEKALSLLKFRKALQDRGLLTAITNDVKGSTTKTMSAAELDSTISKIEEKKDGLIKKIFDSIDKPIYPVYIVLKAKKKVYSEPKSSAKAIPEASNHNEFKFLALQDNWYNVQLPSSEQGWVKWKDINLIYENKANPITLSNAEKAEIHKKYRMK